MATDDIIRDIDTEPEEQNEHAAMTRRLDNTVHRIQLLQSTVIESSEQGDPETLSRTLVKLANENSNLGLLAAKLTYLANMATKASDAERYKKRIRYLNEKYTVAKAETQSKIDTEDLSTSALEMQGMADEANNLGYRISDLLEMGRSRLSLIKDAVKG